MGLYYYLLLSSKIIYCASSQLHKHLIDNCLRHIFLHISTFCPSGVGITGGVHRLWAHRSYKATFPLRVYLMLSNSIANQGNQRNLLMPSLLNPLSNNFLHSFQSASSCGFFLWSTKKKFVLIHFTSTNWYWNYRQYLALGERSPGSSQTLRGEHDTDFCLNFHLFLIL